MQKSADAHLSLQLKFSEKEMRELQAEARRRNSSVEKMLKFWVIMDLANCTAERKQKPVRTAETMSKVTV